MRKILCSITLLLLTFSILAQKGEFQKKEFIFKGDTLRYQVLFPDNYDANKKYPLVLFLHGAGEKGSDNVSQLTHGSTQFTNEENRKNYPAIVIFPQCPEDSYWVEIDRSVNEGLVLPKNPTITKPLYLTKKLLDSYKNDEGVDKNRIYIMGLSMGGMGTFDLIVRYPKYFAAAIPICGAVEPARLKKLKKMPIRMFHGSMDEVVSCEFSRNAFIELKARGSQRVEYIEFPGVGHDSWTPAFAYPDYLGWLFYQHK